MSTREKILDTALKLFNEAGVHAVGVRDIARALGMSPGNLQYHFAKKELLVAALVRRLHESANAAVTAMLGRETGFAALHELTLETLASQIPYRGLLISYAEIVADSKDLRALGREMEAHRPTRMRKAVDALVANGHVDAKKLEGHEEMLRLQIEGLGRLWIPAAVVAGNGRRLGHAADLRARLMLHLWRPYATPKGLAEIDDVLRPPQ